MADERWLEVAGEMAGEENSSESDDSSEAASAEDEEAAVEKESPEPRTMYADRVVAQRVTAFEN